MIAAGVEKFIVVSIFPCQLDLVDVHPVVDVYQGLFEHFIE